MSTPITCCTPCPEKETVNVPGVEGDPGTAAIDGTDGIDSFTVTTADFSVPAIGANVTVSVVNSEWMTVGQNVFVQGAGYFAVSSKPTTTSAILTYLNYSVNTFTGNTISAGAQISPGGTEPSQTLLPAIPDYATGGSQALSVTPSQALSLSVTLTNTQTYLLMATLRLDFDVATLNSNETVTAKLRRTNNTPADIPNSIENAATGTPSASSATMVTMALPPVTYPATANDTVQLYVSITGLPYSGAVNVVEASIIAIPLF